MLWILAVTCMTSLLQMFLQNIIYFIYERLSLKVNASKRIELLVLVYFCCKINVTLKNHSCAIQKPVIITISTKTFTMQKH